MLGQWQDGAPCTGGTPFCSAGMCLVPPSCNTGAVGAGMDCGPNANENCCTSLPVTGGTFYRSYDGAAYSDQTHPATVSSYKLDKYETTVGRFRVFVNAWVNGWRPAAGAGKHTHLNGGSGLANSASAGTYEAGWDATWEAGIATAAAGWDTNLACEAPYSTWTPTAGNNEKRPINCASWYEAYAFCLWDGGFLPSDAEWNYAAAGGAEQRPYPWGSTAPGANADLAVYGCFYNGTGMCTAVTNLGLVGSVPAGAGKYGQVDLAGNLAEWNLDRNGTLSTACNDCTYVGTTMGGVNRGGAFYLAASNLLVSHAGSNVGSDRNSGIGARCARIP
jgi:formylglycine-generating enzyme required for sulfatase activity